MKLMEKATTKAFWEAVRTEETYRELREQTMEIYQQKRWDTIPVLPFAARRRFYIDGDRLEFQENYYRRRHYLASAALLALIYPEEETYLKETEEIAWAICEEYSWVLPAHCPGDARDLDIVDLFSAETAFAFAEIIYLLQDRLHPAIIQRIKMLVERDILDVYAAHTFWWDKGSNNWAAVCTGNIGGAIMYLFPERLDEFLPRILETMQRFLGSFSADGACLEGASYWNYGFGNYIWFADLLYQYTDGKTNLFTWEKTEKIAMFMQRVFLKGNTSVSFSDCSSTYKADRALQSFLMKTYPDAVMPLDPVNCVYATGTAMWQRLFRNLYYLDNTAFRSDAPLQDHYLPDAGQVILNRKLYSLSAKAGHNNEPHNHNDVGNFILSTQQGQVICDLGAGLYTRDYFPFATRYTYFCNSSASHNVPIIDGNFQQAGVEKNYHGTLAYGDNSIRIDFRNAYEIPALEKLERTISCAENTVTVTDCFQVPYETYTERFVSFFSPELADGVVKVADVIISYDPKICSVQINQEPFLNHINQTKTVYCIDFSLQKGLDTVTFTFTVQENRQEA